MVRRNSKFLAILSPLLTAATLVAANACSQPPDPAVEALTAGVWHGYVPDDETSVQPGGDVIFELDFEERFFGGGTFSGRSYLVVDGKHFSELPVTGASLDGRAVEIRLGSFRSYQGEADLEGGRIVGGIPGGLYEELNLTRVEARQWPMIRLRPAPAPGEPTPVWTRPAERDDGWSTAAPSEVGIDPGAVEETVQSILAGEAGALHSFLVVRDGFLVVEEYFHGWGPDDLHQFASCTKSVASLLVGIAIDQGLVSGVDAALLDFFPGYSEVAGRGWEGVRLEHLLTMTVILDWTDRESSSLTPRGVDRFADILGRNVVVPPGERFRYTERSMNLLPGVLRQATGVRADVYAAEHLFAPLGMTAWDWEKRSWEGHPDMIGSLELRPRDMAKLGQLVLAEGSWQGRRVISAEWIRESTRAHVSPARGAMDYGYFWWRRDSRLGVMTLAAGTGSHFIMAVPDARMVIVTTAGNQFNQQHDAVHRVIDQHLVPGVSLDR